MRQMVGENFDTELPPEVLTGTTVFPYQWKNVFDPALIRFFRIFMSLIVATPAYFVLNTVHFYEFIECVNSIPTRVDDGRYQRMVVTLRDLPSSL